MPSITSNILPIEMKDGVKYTPYERTYNKKDDFNICFQDLQTLRLKWQNHNPSK